MAGGDTHLFDVQGAHALLDGGGGVIRRVLLAQEIRLERHHARVDEQQVGVVQDQRGTGNLRVAQIGEVLDEALADLMRLHVS